MFYKIVNGSISYSADIIFDEINFDIHDKEKIAIIGRNGSGKTTLLRAIVGDVEMEQGIGDESLLVKSHGIDTIGYLKQITFDNDELSLVEEIRKVYQNVINIEKELEIASKNMELDSSEQNIKTYSNLLEKYENSDGYTYKREYELAISKFGFDEEEKNRPLKNFSGGQRTKIALLKLLLSKPDILLLDEPTNNLDLPTVLWLENYLKNYKKTMVIVSHDRMFLDHIVNVVYEIEWGNLTRYDGNYTSYHEQKEANYQKQLKDHTAQKKEIERLNHFVDRFIYKPTKSSLAKSVRKKVAKMELIAKPKKEDLRSFYAKIKPAHRSAYDVLTCDQLAIGYSNKIIQTISLSLKRGEKLGIIGENGTGKSTFIKTIIGELNKIKGRFFIGENVEIGYFSQVTASSKLNATVYDSFAHEYPSATPQEIRDFLGSFQFSGDDILKNVNSLSGGEKVRLALAILFRRRPNVLILDEPTNHMDVVGKETLETMLQNYDGTVIIVSHDRYFVNKVANRIMVFTSEGYELYDMTYEDYIKFTTGKELIAKPVKKKPKEKKIESTEKIKTDNSKEVKRLEQEINDYEEEIKELRLRFEDDEIINDYHKAYELDALIEEKEKIVENLLEELDELI